MTLRVGEGGKLREIHKKLKKKRTRRREGRRKKDKRPGQTGRSHTGEKYWSFWLKW